MALADSLEALFERIGCALAESDLHLMVETDLSMSQFKCLVALAGDGQPIPIHELAERLGLSFATAGRTVDRLVAQGLVIRREDPHDRRVRRVCASPKGLHIISGIDGARRKALLTFVESLSPSDRSALHAALGPIVHPISDPSPRLEEQVA